MSTNKSLSPNPVVKYKRKRVSKACQPCKKSHISCNTERPCKRCIERQCIDQCIDVESRRRGRRVPDNLDDSDHIETPSPNSGTFLDIKTSIPAVPASTTQNANANQNTHQKSSINYSTFENPTLCRSLDSSTSAIHSHSYSNINLPHPSYPRNLDELPLPSSSASLFPIYGYGAVYPHMVPDQGHTLPFSYPYPQPLSSQSISLPYPYSIHPQLQHRTLPLPNSFPSEQKDSGIVTNLHRLVDSNNSTTSRENNVNRILNANNYKDLTLPKLSPLPTTPSTTFAASMAASSREISIRSHPLHMLVSPSESTNFKNKEAADIGINDSKNNTSSGQGQCFAGSAIPLVQTYPLLGTTQLPPLQDHININCKDSDDIDILTLKDSFTDDPFTPNQTPSTYMGAEYLRCFFELLKNICGEDAFLLGDFKNAVINYGSLVLKVQRTLSNETAQQINSEFAYYLQLFSSAFDKLSIPTVIWERCGVIHYVNNSFKNLTAFSYSLPTRRRSLAMIKMIEKTGIKKMYAQLSANFMKGDVIALSCGILDEHNVKANITSSDSEYIPPSGAQYIQGHMYITVKRDIIGLPLIFVGNFVPSSDN